MTHTTAERHQIAGLDARERGFNRPVECGSVENGYRAILRYETIEIATEPQASIDAALLELVKALRQQGYRQLRSQLSVRSGIYLGSQEPWVEYPDPEPQQELSTGLIGKLLHWWRGSATG